MCSPHLSTGHAVAQVPADACADNQSKDAEEVDATNSIGDDYAQARRVLSDIMAKAVEASGTTNQRW